MSAKVPEGDISTLLFDYFVGERQQCWRSRLWLMSASFVCSVP